MRRSLLALVLSSVLLVSCTSATDQKGEAAPGGKYMAYSEGVIGNGEPALLFFTAADCEACAKADTSLTTMYMNNVPLSTYKVEGMADLEQRYNVTYHPMFIKIDGAGNLLMGVEEPDEQQIRELMGS